MDDSDVAGIGHNHPPEPTLSELLSISNKKLADQVEQLAIDANSVKALVDAAETPGDDGKAPGLTEELVEKMVDVGKRATKLAGSNGIDKDRMGATQSRREEIETINGFFNVMKTRVERIKTAFSEKVSAYVAEKQAQEKREAAERARIAQDEAAAKLKEAEASSHSVMGDVIMNEAAVLEDAAQKAAREAVAAGSGPMRAEAGTVSQSGKWTFSIEDADKIPLDQLRPFIKLADLEKFLRAYATANRDTKPLAGVRFHRETKTTFR